MHQTPMVYARFLRREVQWHFTILPVSCTPDLGSLWFLLSNIVAPFPQGLDYFWKHCGCKWHSEEYEGFVDQVGKTQLAPDCYDQD